jgi:hypothetical protein
MNKTILFIILLPIFFLGFSSQEACAQIPTRLRVIEASNVGRTIDPSLKELHGQLSSLFKYTSYRLLRDERLHLSLNQTTTLPVHPGRSIEITPLKFQANTAELRVKIKREKTEILDTQVRLPPGRTVLIGGPRHGEGVVILAFSSLF